MWSHWTLLRSSLMESSIDFSDFVATTLIPKHHKIRYHSFRMTLTSTLPDIEATRRLVEPEVLWVVMTVWNTKLGFLLYQCGLGMEDPRSPSSHPRGFQADDVHGMFVACLAAISNWEMSVCRIPHNYNRIGSSSGIWWDEDSLIHTFHTVSKILGRFRQMTFHYLRVRHSECSLHHKVQNAPQRVLFSRA